MSSPKSLNKWTVKQLKEELEKRNLTTKGLKADLIARLQEDDGSKGLKIVEVSDSKQDTKEHTEEPNKNATSKAEKSTHQLDHKTDNKQEQKEDKKENKKEDKREEVKEHKKEEKKEDKKREEKIEEHKEEKKIEPSKTPEKIDIDKDKKRKETESPTISTPTSASKRQRKWTTSESPDSSLHSDALDTIIAEKAKKDKEKPKEESKQNNSSTHMDSTSTSTSTTSSSTVNSVPIKLSTNAHTVTNTEVTPKLDIDQATKKETRTVPPSRKAASNVLFIRNFVRPFSKQAVEELVSQKGKPKQWAMDSVKSKCYVIYESKEIASATREEIHNLLWPPSNKTTLFADFATEEEANKFLQKEADTKMRPQNNNQQQQQKQVVPEPTLTLDDLFRKTEAKPPIYWLPLTDQQVAQKRAAKSSSSNVSATSSDKK